MDDDKTQRTYIPIEGKLRRDLDRLDGAVSTLTALETIPERDRTAGFRLALAIAEREVADRRVRHGQNALRAAAAAGVDVSRSNLMTQVEDGKLVLFAVPFDLVDHAED